MFTEEEKERRILSGIEARIIAKVLAQHVGESDKNRRPLYLWNVLVAKPVKKWIGDTGSAHDLVGMENVSNEQH